MWDACIYRYNFQQDAYFETVFPHGISIERSGKLPEEFNVPSSVDVFCQI